MKTVKRKIIKWLIIFLGLVIISTFITYGFMGDALFQSFRYFIEGTLYGTAIGCTFWFGNSLIGYITARKINWKKNLQRANLISLLSFILFGIVASIIVPYIYYKYFLHKTGDSLKWTVLLGSFINLSVDIIVISIYYSVYLVKSLKQAIENEEKLERENLIAKYEALKNQVNPHFLFNSLNTLTGVVERDQKKAVEFIKRLSNTYRYVLDQRDKELIPIAEELKFVNDYIYLAKLRHGDGLSFNNSISSLEKLIIPLGIQMLVENCIKHNVLEDDRPLSIELLEEEGYIVVKNNFQKKTSIKQEEQIGLENLKNRYSYVTSLPVVVDETSEAFSVKIPLLTESIE